MHMQVHTADHRLSVRQADLPMLQSTKDDRMQEPRLRVRRRIPLRTREGSLRADCGEHRLGRRRNTQVGGADRKVLDCGWATALNRGRPAAIEDFTVSATNLSISSTAKTVLSTVRSQGPFPSP